jgi:hypothetical protein
MNLHISSIYPNLKARRGDIAAWFALAAFIVLVNVSASWPGTTEFEQKKATAWSLVEACYSQTPKSSSFSIDDALATSACYERERVFHEAYGARPAGQRAKP